MIKNENTNQNEVRNSIPFKYVPTPTNLMFFVDSDCLKMLILLMQEESYWKSKGKLVDGYFFKSIDDLKKHMLMSNDQDVRLTLDALYINKLIDIIPQGQQHKASKIKINQERINEVDKMTITDVEKFLPKVLRLKRGSKCSYLDKKGVNSITPEATILSTNCTSDCTSDCTQHSTPKLYNIDKSNKIDNNIIVDNIIAEVPREKDSNNPNLISKGLIDDSNGKHLMDASATKAAAQTKEQTKGNVINEDKLGIKLKQDFDRLEREDFYKNLYSYSIAELKDLQNKRPTLPLSMNDTEKGYIVYQSTKILRSKGVS